MPAEIKTEPEEDEIDLLTIIKREANEVEWEEDDSKEDRRRKRREIVQRRINLDNEIKTNLEMLTRFECKVDFTKEEFESHLEKSSAYRLRQSRRETEEDYRFRLKMHLDEKAKVIAGKIHRKYGYFRLELHDPLEITEEDRLRGFTDESARCLESNEEGFYERVNGRRFLGHETGVKMGKIGAKKIFNETEEERALRLAKDRMRKWKQIVSETEEEKARRRERDRIRKLIRIRNETDEERAIRREKDRIRKSMRIRNETEEERALRLEKNRKRRRRINGAEETSPPLAENPLTRTRLAISAKEESSPPFTENSSVKTEESLYGAEGDRIIRFASLETNPSGFSVAIETGVKRVVKRARDRMRKSKQFLNETDEKRLIRLEKDRIRKSMRLLNETEEERALRLERDRTRKTIRRLNETRERKAFRLEKDRERKAVRLKNETREQRMNRLERDRMRKRSKNQAIKDLAFKLTTIPLSGLNEV